MRPQGLPAVAVLLVGTCIAWGPQAGAQALGGAFSDESVGGGQGYRSVGGSTARGKSGCAPSGNLSAGSWLELGDCLALEEAQAPTAAGTLTLNGQSCASADVAIIDGPVTIGASWDPTAYFTNTADSRHAIVIIKGNLTVSSGEVFTPPVRKLSWYLHVTGDTTLTGDASMTARGANHSATGSDLVACAMRIATGTYSSVVNPEVPAAGGAGAPGANNSAGIAGSAGAGGGLGGGGSGGAPFATAFSGAGAAGTAYSGGSASGGARNTTGGDAALRGGKGGDGALEAGGSRAVGGGAGNPGGAGASSGTGVGEDGASATGGVFVFAVGGALSGSGSITSHGGKGGDASGTDTGIAGGGGSGGGHVTGIVGSGTITTAANGGAGGTVSGSGQAGGAGGIGTARVLVTP